MRRFIIAAAVMLMTAATLHGQNFFLTVTPEQLTINAGNDGQIAVQVVGSGGFNGTVSIQMPVVPDVTLTPAAFTQVDGGITNVLVSVAADAASRSSFPITFQGSAPSVGNRLCTFQLTIIGAPAPPPDFVIEAMPVAIRVEAGDDLGDIVQVSATRRNGFNGPINVTAPADAGGLTFDPAAFIFAPSQTSQDVKVTAREGAKPGHRSVVFTATAPGVDGTRTTGPVDVEVLPSQPKPEIDALDPRAVIRGARSQIIRVTGRNFVAGASAAAADPAITIERVTVINSRTADVTLSVADDLPPGAYRIDLTNPDGGASQAGADLLVYPPDSPGAPVSVITAAIVFPAEGSIVPTDRATHPRAVIATSGSGVITGSWRVGGVPFERFSVDVAGGEPAEVIASAAIPHLTWGDNTLELMIDSPRIGQVATIRIIGASTSSTALRLLRPADRAIVEERRPRFGWSLVPGADEYEIELVRVAENGDAIGEPLLVRVADAEWRPTEARRGEIGDGRFRWRVRAIFPGGVRGQPTAWRTITLTPRPMTSAAPATSVARQSEYVFTPAATIDWNEGRDPVARLQTSTQGDLRGARGETKYTGDLSWRATADPSTFSQESRNWLASGLSPARAVRVGATVGLTTPAFTTGGEYLGIGLARQSVTARVSSRFGSISYYQPTDNSMAGAVSIRNRASGIRALGFESPAGNDSFFRLIALEVDELRTIGILGSRRISPRLKLDFEAARASAGDAFRFGVSGTVKKTRYGLMLRHTDAGFVNPAQRGFSRGSFSNRTSADLSLARSFGVRSLSVTMRRIESGAATQSATTMQFRMPLPRAIALTLAGNASLDEAPASGRLPRSERLLRGLTLTLTKRMAKLTLVQSAGYQSTDDRVSRFGDRNVISVSTALTGDLMTSLALMASLGGTRSENSFGRQDNVNALVEPSITLPGDMLRFIPSFAWQRSTVVTRQARAIAEWTCPQCIVAFQLSAGWIRSANRTTREIKVAFALSAQRRSGS